MAGVEVDGRTMYTPQDYCGDWRMSTGVSGGQLSSGSCWAFLYVRLQGSGTGDQRWNSGLVGSAEPRGCLRGRRSQDAPPANWLFQIAVGGAAGEAHAVLICGGPAVGAAAARALRAGG